MSVGLVLAAFGEFFPCALFLGVGVVTACAVAISKRSQARTLHELAEWLDDGQCQAEPQLLQGAFEGWRVTGALRGKRVRLDFTVTGSGKSRRVFANYEIEVPYGLSTFKVTRTTLLNRLGRAMGLVTDTKIGDATIDQKYILEGNPQDLRDLFRQAPKLEWSFDDLFTRFGFDSVELLRGIGPGLPGLGVDAMRLRAVRTQTMLDPKALRGAFEALHRIASYCERRPIASPKLKVRAELKTYAWTYGGAGPRCPFCRDAIELEASSEDVAACEGCGTVHHAECLIEAGGCTVYGCARAARHGDAPARPRRARARAEAQPRAAARPQGRRIRAPARAREPR